MMLTLGMTVILTAGIGCGGYGTFEPWGPADLMAYQQEHAEALRSWRNQLRTGETSTVDAEPILQVMDAVGRQRDNVHGLFWFTDLERARAEAEAAGRPILSLRMLGQLDEELSCANSRFFRTALYSNADVAEFMKEHYVLHWESVRPAPVMTIDFGDGRTMRRTVTGNSCHLLLDTAGRPFDAIPGLYGPAEFMTQLERGAVWHDMLAKSEGNRSATLAMLHSGAHTTLRMQQPLRIPLGMADIGGADAPRMAVAAERLTASKMAIELPLLEGPDLGNDSGIDFAALARSRPQVIGDVSRGLIRRDRPELSPAAFDRMVERFEQTVAIDTLRNEWTLHREIHAWFAAGANLTDPATFTARIYDELFLTPDNDPWLGLYEDTLFTGLTSTTEFGG